MYMNTGYLNHSHMDFKDKSRPLVVGSCGTYRLSSHPKLPTYRPRGRLDYQIIYITAGYGHFHFDNMDNETIVTAGNIVPVSYTHLYYISMKYRIAIKIGSYRFNHFIRIMFSLHLHEYSVKHMILNQ